MDDCGRESQPRVPSSHPHECINIQTKPTTRTTTQLILLDPVSLLLGLPDVCYNFLHKQPRSLMEYIVHYLGATVRQCFSPLLVYLFYPTNLPLTHHRTDIHSHS